jgi:RIO-like serine/threonine protein kinase
MPNQSLPEGLAAWAGRSLDEGQNILATSNQGTVLLYQSTDASLVVKAAMGSGTVLRARRRTLDREYAAYQRLEGVPGVPRCHGMLEDRFLVLDYVEGTPYREADIEDRDAWFAQLLETLRACHERGVAHGDLKNKSNLMSTATGRPCVIDFGLTVVRKEGFHPINHRLFAYFCQLDLNAWVKHKYQGRFEDVSEADRELYHDSRLERLLRGYRQRKGLQGPR